MLARKRLLGEYNLGKTIGQGAFSKVKIASHRETGEKVAIKVIDKKLMEEKAKKSKAAHEERERKRQMEELKKARAKKSAEGAGGDKNGQPDFGSIIASASVVSSDRKTSGGVTGGGGGGGGGQITSTGGGTGSVPGSEPVSSNVHSVPGGMGTSSVGSGDGHGPLITIAPNTPTAMPVMPARPESNPVFISNLQKEVQLMMRLDHPHIIKIYQVLETEEECFIVMEYAKGGELIDYIAARDHLTEREARRFFRQIISALDHCHLASVVHRDLKLENLLLNHERNVLISDFGLGRTFNPDVEEYMKTFCGTPNYAAVELISGIPYVGVKSDIWAMGVVLYIMMTGRPPFQGETISLLYRQIKAVEYDVPPYFSADLVDLLRKILLRDPGARIDMDGLRSHPWINYEYIHPPLRIMPRIMGVVDAGTLSQVISSIYSDKTFVVYVFRRHKRQPGIDAPERLAIAAGSGGVAGSGGSGTLAGDAGGPRSASPSGSSSGGLGQSGSLMGGQGGRARRSSYQSEAAREQHVRRKSISFVSSGVGGGGGAAAAAANSAVSPVSAGLPEKRATDTGGSNSPSTGRAGRRLSWIGTSSSSAAAAAALAAAAATSPGGANGGTGSQGMLSNSREASGSGSNVTDGRTAKSAQPVRPLAAMLPILSGSASPSTSGNPTAANGSPSAMSGGPRRGRRMSLQDTVRTRLAMQQPVPPASPDPWESDTQPANSLANSLSPKASRSGVSGGGGNEADDSMAVRQPSNDNNPGYTLGAVTESKHEETHTSTSFTSEESAAPVAPMYDAGTTRPVQGRGSVGGGRRRSSMTGAMGLVSLLIGSGGSNSSNSGAGGGGGGGGGGGSAGDGPTSPDATGPTGSGKMSILNRRRVSSASAFGGSRPTPTPVRAGTTVEDDRGYEIMRRMSAVSPIPDQTPTSPLPPSAEEPADFFIDTSLSLSRASRAGSWLESSSSNDGVGGPMSPTTGSTGMGGAGLSSSGNTKMLQAHFKSRLGRDGAVYPAPSPPPSTGINGSTDMSGPGAVSSVASPPMSPLSTAMPKLPPLPTAIDASAGSSNVQPLTLTITGLTSSSSAQAPAPAKSPATFEPSMQEIEAWHLTHKPPKEIRSMRFSFNSSTTSATIDPATMFQDVHRVLMFVSRMYNGNLKYSRVPDYYMFRCEMPDAETPDVPLEFEVEICKVWLLKVHGLRMKRISGNVFAFKDIYSQFVADLHWT